MKVFIDNVVDEAGNEKGKLYIESDTLGYQVKTITGMRIDDKGKESEISTTHGHFCNISGCINHLVRMKLHESTATTLSELLQEVKDIREYIESKVAV